MTKPEIQKAIEDSNTTRQQVVDLQHAHEQALIADANGTARVVAPVGHVDPISVTVDAGGVKVVVEVFDAVFGDKAQRFASKPEGTAWCREQRVAWQAEHEAVENKARFVASIEREHARLFKIGQEASYVIDDAAISCLNEALEALNRACM